MCASDLLKDILEADIWIMTLISLYFNVQIRHEFVDLIFSAPVFYMVTALVPCTFFFFFIFYFYIYAHYKNGLVLPLREDS